MCLRNMNAPGGNKVTIGYFLYKRQGHKVIDLVSFERVSLD